jgi:hypothetical protein
MLDISRSRRCETWSDADASASGNPRKPERRVSPKVAGRAAVVGGTQGLATEAESLVPLKGAVFVGNEKAVPGNGTPPSVIFSVRQKRAFKILKIPIRSIKKEAQDEHLSTCRGFCWYRASAGLALSLVALRKDLLSRST